MAKWPGAQFGLEPRAQEHQGVEFRGVDGPDQGSQRRRAAVNVANRYRASFGHAVFVSLVLRDLSDQPGGRPCRLRLDALLPQLELMGLPFRSPGERVLHGMPEHEVSARQ